MRKIHEVLRLYFEHVCPERGVARIISVFPSTESDYVARAKLAGRSSPLPPECDDASLERLLFPPSEPPSVQRPAPAWPTVYNELRRKGVTLELLWQTYKAEQSEGYQYSAFCEHYRHWRQQLTTSMRQTHTPGVRRYIHQRHRHRQGDGSRTALAAKMGETARRLRFSWPSATNIGTLASGGVALVSKLVTAVIMWFGAGLVIGGKLSGGELIAFNMLAAQIATPIIRLAQLWNDFQQVGISVSRLGDILNTPTETTMQKSRLPRLDGAIVFDAVSFRYRPEAPLVIQDLHLKIAPGEVIGIVGCSGSGKSTLTKLVQRLYVPENGRVMIDGHDIAIVDAASLRQQLGVVLQENTLFMRSVRDNIALSNPAFPLEAIVAASQAGRRA